MANLVFKIFLLFFCQAVSPICEQFFDGKPWPKPSRVQGKPGIVELCQTQVFKNGMGKPVFATLFSTEDKIPIYSANVVQINLDQNVKRCKRPGSMNWRRVAFALCDPNMIPNQPIYSQIRYLDNDKNLLEECGKLQALDTDYKMGKSMGLQRGHLCPNGINAQDEEKQLGTFTLTNVAPQYAEFEKWWRVVECITEKSISDKKVYIITGTDGIRKYENNEVLKMSTVTVPGYYWKAVCYPGTSDNLQSAWGFAVVMENSNKNIKPICFNDFITLGQFSRRFFSENEPPFSENCLNAPLGEELIKKEKNWTGLLKSCQAPKVGKCKPITKHQEI